MNSLRQRPLTLNTLRAFAAVAERLSFSAAADHLSLTQPAISRQIQSLEQELGTPLFVRATRKVALTQAGLALMRVVQPWLAQLDGTVRRLRLEQTRQPVVLTTFASFASLWLLPRLGGFQLRHPEVDIRISASDHFVALDDPETDMGVRHCRAQDVPPQSTPLFGEVVTPVASPGLLERQRLRSPADLRQHTWLEEDDRLTGAGYFNWSHWLDQHKLPGIQPRGWLYLNYTYQQIQAALAGQGIALARLALVADLLQRGDLVEPFGPALRLTTPYRYWLVRWPERQERPAVDHFEDWLLEQAAMTSQAFSPT